MYKILYNYLLIGTMRCDILDITSETINVREQMCRLPAFMYYQIEREYCKCKAK